MSDRAFQRNKVARAISLILGTAVAFPAVSQEGAEVEEVVVTGIRGSLTSSMELKRDSQGVMDGIVAEDIGKFPDTNLAESMQRVSGVSIDRSLGEGSKVTVRGVGPDFNLVLLNGRQMPASALEDTGASPSRAFDFANLASESISAIEVYKTSRASTPTGGIGATINIKTARPLDNPGLRTSFGAKGVMDTSVDNLPDALQGDSITPEVSGIYSDTFADDKFGIAVSASYQERDFGFNQAAVANGWKAFAGDENNWGTIPQPGAPGSENITNRPGPNDTYSVPQNLGYSVTGIERKRTNGQLTLQYAPTDTITTTLDYTYSENKIAQQRNELSVWFNFGPSTSTWTDGPVSSPLIYSETIVPATSDLSMGGAKFATKNENKSLGFNVEWQATDRLGLAFDYHDSSAESGADSPYGSNAVLGVAGFFRGTTTADFSRDFPVMSVELPPGQNGIDASQMEVTGSSFRNSYMKTDIKQAQLTGNLEFLEDSRLDFGVALTDVKNRSAFSNVQRDTWSGATSPADYPDDVWRADTVRQYFDNISGSGNPALFNQFFTFDFETVRAIAARAAGDESLYRTTPIFDTDRRVEEESQSAFIQYSTEWEWGLPMQGAVGLRYEKTDVTARALVPIPTGILWVADNEFSLQTSGGTFEQLEGDYDYVLPSLDFAVDITDSLKARASYGHSIGRPLWNNIQGGRTINSLVRIEGGTGIQGNPKLKPLESENIDLSLEWYYGDSNYMAVGYFRKNIDNYIGTSVQQQSPYELLTPSGGAYFNAAVAAGCTTSTCIRQYIFTNFAGQPGVTVTGTDETTGDLLGTIAGVPGDPIASFAVQVPLNQRSASLDGWEFNIQHMFGDTGFGVSANYTLVDSDLVYDNYSRSDQFALVGLSDAANLVAFFENDKFGVRAAYNWRDKFLANTFDGGGLPNPVYTEAYGQIDLTASYTWNENLTVTAEVINLTDEIYRQHGRTTHQLITVQQTGPRYMIGARYKFGD
ncbi:TonB-dependent receptor [Steroidobacter sp. S1-65]|uniref:TonB-dependent receptor n=1 Tax=Steroidobacter gossypii TaxID=2805490 RepID=A0ABS1WRZ3_9GAMM|nr:TonB-dependent receptor [Steroidobacter gossypii]MBM0103727.1 TonB-dependent receptor [Steroidobacter gossypii]